jgi:hypothetical protein
LPQLGIQPKAVRAVGGCAGAPFCLSFALSLLRSKNFGMMRVTIACSYRIFGYKNRYVYRLSMSISAKASMQMVILKNYISIRRHYTEIKAPIKVFYDLIFIISSAFANMLTVQNTKSFDISSSLLANPRDTNNLMISFPNSTFL